MVKRERFSKVSNSYTGRVNDVNAQFSLEKNEEEERKCSRETHPVNTYLRNINR